jgi:hypothetical protein
MSTLRELSELGDEVAIYEAATQASLPLFGNRFEEACSGDKNFK